jgi:hypothetical protein
MRLDLVATRGTRQREVEGRLCLEPRSHVVLPSAARMGFRTIGKVGEATGKELCGQIATAMVGFNEAQGHGPRSNRL